MRPLYLLFLLFILLLPATRKMQAQTFSVQQIIKCWEVTDATQTLVAGSTYADVIINYKPENYHRIVEQLEEYIRSHQSTRLSIRLLLYKEMSRDYWEKNDTKQIAQEFFELLKVATHYGDQQLVAEVLERYLKICPPNKSLYYILKTLKIEESIGIEHFSGIANLYYSASRLLYNNSMDYATAARYAARGVETFYEPYHALHQYILIVDMAGAAYLKINNPDSAIFYYRKIIEYLVASDSVKTNLTNEQKEIWRGVAQGGIARAFSLQQKYDTAYALLTESIQSSKLYSQWNNAAIVLSSMGAINYSKKKFPLAVKQYRQARQWALIEKQLPILITAVKGLSDAFAATKQYDSAYIYHQLYLGWKDTMAQNLDIYKVDMTKAQLEYESLQTEVLASKTEINKQRGIRNTILIGIAFLILIASLLYNRYRLQQKWKREKLEKEKLAAEAETATAKEQLLTFTQNIAEKNKLIESLQQQSGLPQTDTHLLTENTILTDEDWMRFRNLFSQAYPGFLDRLVKQIPGLSPAEIRFLSLYKLNISSREIAAMLGISGEAVRKQNYRLRKKLEITYPNIELNDFIQNI